MYLTGLDALVEGDTILGNLLVKLVEDVLSQQLGHPVVVFGQVGEIGELTFRHPCGVMYLFLNIRRGEEDELDCSVTRA